MAPSKKKPIGRRNAKLVEQNPFSSRRCCDSRYKNPPRSHKNVDIHELVYQLLNVQKPNQGRRRTWPPSQKGRMPRERRERCRGSRKCPYEAVSLSQASSECEDASIENLTETTDAASSSATQSSTNGDINNPFIETIRPGSVNGTRALLKKKSFVEIINNYIKAGIEEGKRQAKMYIRKALCFGVKSGYLIPADSKGQVLKVSSTLVDSKRSDTESRKRRRQARKGEESIGQSIERKNSSSWHIRTARDENTTLPPRRKTNRPKRKVSNRNSKTAKNKDSVENSARDDKERPKRGRKRKIRAGKVEKKRTQRKSVSKESLKRSRASSKSPSNHDVNTDRDLDERNWSDNGEKCHRQCKAKDVHSESIECPISNRRPLVMNQEESRDDEMEGIREENNDEMKDSVEESNEA